MNVGKVTKWLAMCVFVMGLGGMAMASSGLGVFGAYWDTDEADDAYGFGAKLKLGTDPVYFVARGTYYRDLLDSKGPGDLEAIPVDAGLEFGGELSDGISLYAGGGASYYFLKLDGGGKVDDEVGWYLNAGFEIKLGARVSLFGEALWREIEGTVKNDRLDQIHRRVDLDLSGFGAHVGLMFR